MKNRFRGNLNKPEFKLDSKPLDVNCTCHTCQNYTRAYLRYLLKSKELLSYNLISLHNVHFLVNLTKTIREAIINGNFSTLKNAWI